VLRSVCLLLLGISYVCALCAQNTARTVRNISSAKNIQAVRSSSPIKIDAILDEPAWQTAPRMDSLVEFRPKVGRMEPYANRSETYLLYSDEGIYFAGYLHESTKDSIARELTGVRDGYGTNDYIGIIIDTYQDHLNGFEYFVTPLNEQWDAKMAPPSPDSDNGGEDFSWNAVWESAALIHDDGWSFEIFIPYSAIRFGKQEVQDWGINITRRRRKTEQQYTWNPIDPNVNGFLTQEGYWIGLTNIKPPLRLQLSPYFSAYANHYPQKDPAIKDWSSQFNGGLDLKYGINQAFTLDATLIPDFGQVQSDARVLNLTPFDVQFNENRSFFTEGTELFSKGNLFYSRRIGIEPITTHNPNNEMNADEHLVKNPQESKLINATKISGRTRHGLGIGVLNAVTKARYATVENDDKVQRDLLTDPLTNYNVLVLDQTFGKNSSVSLVNTSVVRSGPDYDATVTAGLFELNDKKNTWNLGGAAAISNLFNYLPNGGTLSGYSHSLHAGKTSGRFRFNVWEDLTDKRYTNRDLGYFTNNNFLDHGVYVGYNWIEPKGFYNRIFLNFNSSLSRLFSPIGDLDEKFQFARVNANVNIQTKKIWWFGGFTQLRTHQNDFYEPRSPGWFFRRGPQQAWGLWYEGNSAKRYYVYAEADFFSRSQFYGNRYQSFYFTNNFRFNKSFSIRHQISYEPMRNDIGFTALISPDSILFARRHRETITNTLNLKYSFTNKMGITLVARHYLSTVENRGFYTLQKDGELKDNPLYNENRDQNVNFFNIDMVYSWQFAPGSFINVVWKNAIFHNPATAEYNYFKNLGKTLQSDQNNNISFKIIYFLDAGRWKKKSES